MRYQIGNVIVHIGTPPHGNPYRGDSLIGASRVNALWALRSGGNTALYTYWYAPAGGGAKQLRGPDEVDWGTSGVDGPIGDGVVKLVCKNNMDYERELVRGREYTVVDMQEGTFETLPYVVVHNGERNVVCHAYRFGLELADVRRYIAAKGGEVEA